MEALIINLIENVILFVEGMTLADKVINVIILIILLNVLKMLFILFRMHQNKSVKFSRPYPGGKRILIAGDSTAVGTGADNEIDTIAGRLSYDFPHTDIENVAVNGALTIDVKKQLKNTKEKNYDLIIISTGGNDVWNFTPLWYVRRNFRKILDQAKEMSGGRVIVLFFGNEGSAPFFPFIIRPFLMRRTMKINKLLSQVTTEKNVPLIDLFVGEKENPFVEKPEAYFAADGLHPSSAGYWLWYKRMWRLMIQHNYLFNENDRVIGE